MIPNDKDGFDAAFREIVGDIDISEETQALDAEPPATPVTQDDVPDRQYSTQATALGCVLIVVVSVGTVFLLIGIAVAAVISALTS